MKKPSRPRPKKKKPAAPRAHAAFGNWDLDSKGEPFYAGNTTEAMMQCAIRYGRGDYRIKRTQKSGRWVNTIFLWVNHQWDPELPPILFETASFCGGKVVICDRYSTRAQALAGHEKWCKVYLE
jgi:hypothetical protein